MAIRDYKPLLISVGPSGVCNETNTQGVWGQAFDTYETYGICVKSCPFAVCMEQKNIITQDWTDKNGHDAYLPDVPIYEPEELSLEFAIVDKDYTPSGVQTQRKTNENIALFINAITSKWLCMYDTYTNIGRRKVYLKGPDGNPEFWERDNKVIITFKLKFVVNNPMFGATNDPDYIFTLTKGQAPTFPS